MLKQYYNEVKLAFLENKSAIYISLFILIFSLILGYLLEPYLYSYFNPVVDDLSHKNQKEIIAKGGRGGRGNTAFKTQTNTAPDYSENGEEGERKNLKVEVKMLADVGLVGLPSVGKSTIISCISASRPKIAAYHFTTLSPNLGVTKSSDGRSFVVADLPGLIEGAHEGEGLGDKFLKHIERTRVIAHVVDMSGSEGRDPIDDYNIIRNELKEFSDKLINKEEIIVANKMDEDEAQLFLQEFKHAFTTS